jgi:hypothetical protein
LQGYEYPAWRQFQNSEYHYLTSVSPNNWNIDWAARVQLYSTVILDAEECAKFNSAVKPPIHSPGELFKTLADGDATRVLRLFDLYVAESPAAAMSVAEQTGLDLLGDHAEVLVRSCLVPPFLSIVLEQCSKDESRPEWQAVVAEAALRYPVVMEQLRELSSPTTSIVEDSTSNIGGRHSAKNELFYSCLSVGLGLDLREANSAFQLLRLYKMAPELPQGRLSQILHAGPISLVLVGLDVIILESASSDFSIRDFSANGWTWTHALGASMFVLYLALTLLVVRASVRFQRLVRSRLLGLATEAPKRVFSLVPPFGLSSRMRRAYLFSILSDWVRRGDPPFDVRNLKLEAVGRASLVAGSTNHINGADIEYVTTLDAYATGRSRLTIRSPGGRIENVTNWFSFENPPHLSLQWAESKTPVVVETPNRRESLP